MTFKPSPHHPGCTATVERFGPFPVTTTKHHPECHNPTDKDVRTR